MKCYVEQPLLGTAERRAATLSAVPWIVKPAELPETGGSGRAHWLSGHIEMYANPKC